MSRYTGILFILVAALAVFAMPQGRAQANGAQPTVREIVIRGNERVAEDQIRPVIKSQVGQPYSAETARADVEAILGLGLFFRADQRTEPMEGGVRLIFTVVENPVITAIDFVGNTVPELSDEVLLTKIKSRPNQVLNREQVTADALAIKEAYASLGYTLVEITDINIRPDGRLEFYIFEPRIGEVRIEPLEPNKRLKTREYVIRRELTFRPGDVYNEGAIRRSLRNLEALGIFEEVTAVPEPGTEPGTLIIAIRVKERRTGLAAIGIGSSNQEGLIGFVDVADTNFRGSGQRISARVQFGQDNSYQLSYTNPWIDQRHTSLTANLYDRSILRQLITNNAADTSVLYNELRSGGNLSFGRPLSDNTRAFVTFRADHIRVDEEDDDEIPAELSSFFAPTDVRSLALSSIRDTRDSTFLPTRGSYLTGMAEFAGLGGDNFTKLTSEYRRYWAVRKPRPVPASAPAGTQQKPPWVLAGRVAVGAIGGEPNPLDQFLVGGADTVRGYEEDSFIGTNMLTVNTELRVPITDALQVVGFLDAGDAWGGEFARVAFGDNAFDLHLGYGAGIRIQTPIGPLRLDYGINEDGGKEFHFGVGPTF